MSQQGKRKTKRLLDFQARNQLGTPGRGEEFSKRRTNFKLCAIDSKYVQHIFPVGAKIFLRGVSPPPGYGPFDFYTSQKTNIFLGTLSALAKFDHANQGVRQPVQLHTLNAQLLVFDETLAQPDFIVVNCSDVVVSVLHSPV